MRYILAALILLVPSVCFGFGGSMGGPVGGASGTSYLIDLDFESTGVSWDTTYGTEVTAGNADADGEWCDADSTSDHYYAGSQGLFIYGGAADAYTELDFTSGSASFIFDTWFRASDTSNSGFVVFYSSDSNYTYTLQFEGAHALRVIGYGAASDFTSTTIIDNNVWTHIRVEFTAGTGFGNEDGEIEVWMSTTDTDFDGDTADYSSGGIDTAAEDTTLVRFNGCYTGDSNAFDNVQVWEPL